MNKLKQFVIRKASEFLAEYVEAIDANDVCISLGYDEGELRLESAKLNKNSDRWKQLGLTLDHREDARRDVSFILKIPWWNYETEPWNVTIDKIHLDAQLLPHSERFVNTDPDVVRENKQRDIQRLEDKSNADPNNVGRIGRLGLAVFRQIELYAKNLEIRVDREPQAVDGLDPMLFKISNVRLESITNEARDQEKSDKADKNFGVPDRISKISVLEHWRAKSFSQYDQKISEEDKEKMLRKTLTFSGLELKVPSESAPVAGQNAIVQHINHAVTDVPVRTSPPSGERIERIPNGTQVKIEETTAEEYKVVWRGQEEEKDGWVSKDYIQATPKLCVGPIGFGVQVQRLIRQDPSDATRKCQEFYVQLQTFDKDPEKYTLCMHSDMVKYVQSLCALVFPPSNIVEQLAPDARDKYILAYTNYLNMGEFGVGDEEQVNDIERVASAVQIVAWRQWCRQQRKNSDDFEAPPTPWWQFWKGGDSSEARTLAPIVSGDLGQALLDAEEQFKDAMSDLDSAFAHCFLEAKVPLWKAKLESSPFNKGQQHDLVFQADEAVVSLDLASVTLHPPDDHADAHSHKVRRTYKMNSCTQLNYLSVTLDSCEPKLFELDRLSETQLSLKKEEDTPWRLRVGATQSHYANETWEVEIRMENAPNHMYLSPWCIHDLLEMGLAWTPDLDNLQQEPKVSPTVKDSGEPAEGNQSDQSSTSKQALGDQQMTALMLHDKQKKKKDQQWSLSLGFHFLVRAPIVHVMLPVGDVNLEIHAGVLRWTSGESAQEDQRCCMWNLADDESDVPWFLQPSFAPDSVMKLRKKSENSDTITPTTLTATLNDFACKCTLEGTFIKLTSSASSNLTVLEGSEFLLDAKKIQDKFVLKAHSKNLIINVSSQLIRAFGELKLGLEYALDPLKPASSSKSPCIDTSPSAGSKPVKEEKEREQRAEGQGAEEKEKKELMTVTYNLERCKVTWDTSTATFERLTSTLNQKQCEFDLETTLSKFYVKDSGVSLLECLPDVEDSDDQAKLTVRQVGRQALEGHSHTQVPSSTTVSVKIPSISACWAKDPGQSFLRTVLSAGDKFSKAEQRAQWIEGRDAWNEYMKSCKRRTAGKVVSEAGERLSGAILQEARPFGLEVADGVRASTEIIENDDSNAFFLELDIVRMSALVKPTCKEKHEAEANEEKHEAEANVKGAVVKVTKKSDITCDVSIKDVEIALGPDGGHRTIVASRTLRDDAKLLSIHAETKKAEKNVDIKVTWAQVALTYHQHDIDMLQHVISDDMVGGVFDVIENTTAQVSQTSPTSASTEKQEGSVSSVSSPSQIPQITYAFDIGAPLVYLSTDLKASRSQTSRGSFLRRVGDEVQMETVCGDGYAIIDFGHLSAKGKIEPDWKLEPIHLELKETKVMTCDAATSDNATPAIHELLRPKGIEATITKKEGIIDLQASVLGDSGAGAEQHVSITRNQVTQWLDIVCCNINYASLSQDVDPTPTRPLSRQVSRQASTLPKEPSSGDIYTFQLKWKEPLHWDIGFTPDSMLMRAELKDGEIKFCSDQEGMNVEVACQSGSVKDLRRAAQNVDKRFIELEPDGSKKGFELKIHMPSGVSLPMTVDIDVARPVLFVLPQLALDLSIWGLSGYQQSQQAKGPQKDEAAMIAAAPEQGDTTQGPQAEFAGMSLKELKDVARVEGIGEDLLGGADFTDDPKAAIIELIQQKRKATTVSRQPLSQTTPPSPTEPARVGRDPRADILIQWMWADAGILGRAPGASLFRKIARANPLRWSESIRVDSLITQFEMLRDTRNSSRPVILQQVRYFSKPEEYASIGAAIDAMQTKYVDPVKKPQSQEPGAAPSFQCLPAGPPADLDNVANSTSVQQDCADDPGIKVNVRVRELGVRIPGSWEDTQKYFEFRVGLNVGVLMTGDQIKIEEVQVSNGSFWRVAPDATVELCKKIEVEAKGRIVQKEEQEGTGNAMWAIRTKDVFLDPIKIGKIKIRYTVSDLTAWGNALNVLTSFEAGTAEPYIELAQRDPLAFSATSVLNVYLSNVHIEPYELELKEDSRCVRPALLVTFSCLELSAESWTPPGKSPQVSARFQQLEVGIRSFNERKGCWEPVLAPCHWSGGLDLNEMNLSMRLDTGSEVRIAVTVPFIHLVSRLGSVQPQARAGGYGEMASGTNLSGLECTVGTVTIPIDGAETLLDDAMLCSVDGDVLTDVVLCFPELPTDRKEVEISLAKEGSKVHDCGDQRALLIRVLMPHPPKRVLLISSTLLIANKTPFDVEARFVDPEKQDDPMKPTWKDEHVISCGGCHACVPVERLHRLHHFDDRGTEDAKPTRSENQKSIHISKHSVVAAPFRAIRDGRAHLQVRPAANATGTWGQTFTTGDVSKAMFSTSEAEGEEECRPVRPQLFHLQEEKGIENDKLQWTNICIEAPFRIANACPCDLHIALWKPGTNNIRDLGVKEVKDKWGGLTIYVKDDDGGLWEVPPKGKDVHIYPLILDHENRFHWYSTTESDSVEPFRPHNDTNSLWVTRDGDTIYWRCESIGARPRQDEIFEEKKLSPQEEHSFYDVRNDDIFVCVALEDQDGHRTEWSACHVKQGTGQRSVGLPLLRQGRMDQDKIIQMRWQTLEDPVRLSARRTCARRTVVFAPNWFVDATGKGVTLMQRDGKKRLPKFGVDGITLPGDLIGEDNPVVSIGWLNHVLKEPVPGLGSSMAVPLCPDKGLEVVLQRDQIAATETCDVMCTLLTAVPRLMAFCKVEGCEIGFRPHRGDPVWLSLDGNASAPLYIPRIGDSDVSVELAARPLGSSEQPMESQWSRAFTINARETGVYPIELMETQSEGRLVCVQVAQTGEFFTITADSEKRCHQIFNRHKCYEVRAHFEGERRHPFVVPYSENERVAIGRSAQSIGDKRLILELHHTNEHLQRIQSQLRTVKLDLTRECIERVERTTGGATAAALIKVKVTPRKTHVIITPMQIGASSDLEYRYNLNVGIPKGLSVTLFDKEAQPVLAGTVETLDFRIDQHASRERKMKFTVGKIQVDVLDPTKNQNVLLASTDNFLKLDSHRVDLAARNMKIKKASAKVGELEVYVDENVTSTVKSYLLNATPRHFGLLRDEVQARVGVPFNVSLHRSGADQLPSTKYEISDMQIGEIKTKAWGVVSASNLPDIVKVLLRITSFSRFLKFDGLKVSLQPQRIPAFGTPAFEGSIPKLGNEMWDKYKWDLISSWRSAIVNSNAVVPLIINPNWWNPQERTISTVKKMSFQVIDGCVKDFAGDEAMSKAAEETKQQEEEAMKAAEEARKQQEIDESKRQRAAEEARLKAEERQKEDLKGMTLAEVKVQARQLGVDDDALVDADDNDDPKDAVIQLIRKKATT